MPHGGLTASVLLQLCGTLPLSSPAMSLLELLECKKGGGTRVPEQALVRLLASISFADSFGLNPTLRLDRPSWSIQTPKGTNHLKG